MSGPSSIPDRFVTDRLALGPMQIADAARVFETYAADIEVTRFLTWTPNRSISQTEAYLAGCVATPTDRSRTYALTSRNDGTLQGAFDLRRIAPHRLEFDMVLARRAWGHGLMSEALMAVVTWASAQPEVCRIGATCDVENGASARVMRKAGLVQEGVLRRWAMHSNLGDTPRVCLAFARAPPAVTLLAIARPPGDDPASLAGQLAITGTLAMHRHGEQVTPPRLRLIEREPGFR